MRRLAAHIVTKFFGALDISSPVLCKSSHSQALISFSRMMYCYPCARRDDTVEDHHGVQISDPYRWLEDPNSEETRDFIKKQNEITFPFLEKCPYRSEINKRLTELWDFPKYGCPTKHGDAYYYYHNTGLQNQSVMYKQETLASQASVFLDANKLSSDGTTAIRGSAFSESGKVFAYGLSDAGSDWVTIKFKNSVTGEDLPDVLGQVKFSSMAWTHDDCGFFYNSYPAEEGQSDGTETTSNLHQKLFYHRIGTAQNEDILCCEWPDNPKWLTGATVSDCGTYLILSICEGCDPINRLYCCNLSALVGGITSLTGLLPVVKIVDNFEAEYQYITNEGSIFTFKTNLSSPRYRLISIDLNNFAPENWTTLIPEHEIDVLEWAMCVNNHQLVLGYLHHVKHLLFVHDLLTGKRICSLPLSIGSIAQLSGDKKYSEIFYKFESFLTPGIIYCCDLDTLPVEPTIFRRIMVKGFDADQFETSQVFYKSKDGTKVPMFIVHKKDLVKNGDHPLLLYGYGGFNISITPYFSVSRSVFMQHFGGIIAVPNIRGGGEYGECWHKSGCFQHKQNVFDDFQMAAEYLIDGKYTSAAKIIINGGSNGGLLVSACANQRPDLFGCVIAQVGVMDMLRFHKFTIGHAWTTDFGCADELKDFEWLIKYSPLHNVKSAPYPAMLLLTGDHDDRVVPLHSLKYIAEVQHVVGVHPQQKYPLMIRVDTKSGHGAGKPTAKVIEELTDVYCFIANNLNLSWK